MQTIIMWFVASRMKAIVAGLASAFVSSVTTWLALNVGVDLPPGFQAEIVSLIVGLVTGSATGIAVERAPANDASPPPDTSRPDLPGFPHPED